MTEQDHIHGGKKMVISHKLSDCIYLTSGDLCTWACPYDSSYDCCINCPLAKRGDKYADCGFICIEKEQRGEAYMSQYMDEEEQLPRNNEVILYYVWDPNIVDYIECPLHHYNQWDELKKYEVYIMGDNESIHDLRVSKRRPDWSQITRGNEVTKKLSDYDFSPPKKGSLNKWKTGTTKTHYQGWWEDVEEGNHIIDVDKEMFLGIVDTYDTESEMFDLPDDNNLYKIGKLLCEELNDDENVFELLTELVALRCTYLKEHSAASSQQRLIWMTANETYHHGGICSEQSLVLQMVMQHIGYPSAIYRPFKNHVAVAVLGNDGDFYKLDTTFKSVSRITDMRRVKGKESYAYVREGAITLDEVETGHKKAALYRRERGKRICARHNIDYNDTAAVLELEYSRAEEMRKAKKKVTKKTTTKATTDERTVIPQVYTKKQKKQSDKKYGFDIEGKTRDVDKHEIWTSAATGRDYIVTYDKETDITRYTPLIDEKMEKEDEGLKKIFEPSKPKWCKDYPPGIIREYTDDIETIVIIKHLNKEWKGLKKSDKNIEDIADKIKKAVFVK